MEKEQMLHEKSKNGGCMPQCVIHPLIKRELYYYIRSFRKIPQRRGRPKNNRYIARISHGRALMFLKLIHTVGSNINLELQSRQAFSKHAASIFWLRRNGDYSHQTESKFLWYIFYRKWYRTNINNSEICSMLIRILRFRNSTIASQPEITP